jgi:hypothetical protein
MKAGTIHILDIDFEFKLWKNRLYHFQSELDIIQGRIFVLVREHPGFLLSKNKQKLLDDQSELVKVMLNNIENMEQEMALYAEDYPIHEKHSHYILHENIRKDMMDVSEKQHEIMNHVYPDLCYPKVMKI